MMSSMKDIDEELNNSLIEHMFKEKFGWELPKAWFLLAWEMYKDERSFKRKYLGQPGWDLCNIYLGAQEIR